jgi:hypothetical protein
VAGEEEDIIIFVARVRVFFFFGRKIVTAAT